MIKWDQLGPDWEFATKHGQASLVGYDVPNKLNMSTQICPCCLQLIYKQKIPMCVTPKKLQFLGFGFPLFYSFLKNCMILLIILICTYSILSIRKAIEHNRQFCYESTNIQDHRRVLASSEGPTCTSFMIQLSKMEQKVSVEQEYLRIASFILQMLFLIYMRDHLTKLQSYYIQRNTLLSDYSIMLKNIPKQKNIQVKLKEFFKRAFPKSYQFKQITLLPSNHQIQKLEKEKSKLIDLLRASYNKNDLKEQDVRTQANLSKIDKDIYEQAQNSKKLAEADQLQCEKVILVFNTDKQKSQILKEFQHIGLQTKGQFFGAGAENIRIKEAPEPKQIMWQNVNVSQYTKIALYILGWGLSFLLLLVATIVFYLVLQQKSLYLIESMQKMKKYEDNQKYKSDYNLAVALTYIMLFFVIIFNKVIMSTLFYKFTQFQRHETRSKFQFSFGLKYLLGLFFTTALMTLAVQAIRFHNYYSHPYGVIQEETIMFFLNAFFTPLFWIFNPFGLARKVKRKIYYGRRGMTQKQANSLMQNSHYDVGKRYAEIIQTIWFVFLYATLIPIGAVISLVGLIIYFWVDKYILLRNSSLGRQISGKIVITNLKLIDVTLALKPIGELLFDIQIRQSTVLVSSIVMLVIGILYLIFPVGKIIQWCNPEHFNFEQKTYEEIKENFKNNYHTEHPVLKIIHGDKMNKKQQKKGLMSNQNGASENLNEGRQYEATSLCLIGKKSNNVNNVENKNKTENVEAENLNEGENKVQQKVKQTHCVETLQ